jgi:hemerythrin HHE cation binding domain-containing protein
MGPSTEWWGETSADHRATVLLRHEHQALLDLFRRQREPAEQADAREALQASIVDLLDRIRHVERDIVFPALPSEYEALVQAFLADQQMLEQCLANLQRASSSGPHATVAGERLELLVRKHLDQQEQWLFTALEREHPHLNAALYERLVDARRAAARPD